MSQTSGGCQNAGNRIFEETFSQQNDLTGFDIGKHIPVRHPRILMMDLSTGIDELAIA